MITAYLSELAVLGHSPLTLRLRRHQLHRWATFLPVPLLEATRDHVVAYLATFSGAEHRASHRAAVRGLYRWLVDTGLAVQDPTVRLPRVRKPKPKPKPCPDPVFARATKVAAPDEYVMLVLGRFAGMRAAEIAHAHHHDLEGELGAESIRILGKGNKERVLPAHPSVVDVLRRAAGWVLPSHRNPAGHVTAGHVTKRLSLLLEGDWTAHSLRHAYGTQVYRESGYDLRLTQEILGHASPATTARYVLVDDDRAGRVVRALRVLPDPVAA